MFANDEWYYDLTISVDFFKQRVVNNLFKQIILNYSSGKSEHF